MTSLPARPEPAGLVGVDRREIVLDSALVTFARFGYRKTSMEEVARAAQISRPGLYFLFDSKEDLFRAAVLQALETDVTEVERILAESDRPIHDRLLDSFDRWTGRYIGPLTRDIEQLIDDNPALLGDIIESYPPRFADLITTAIIERATKSDRETAVTSAQTLISAAIGIKHQVNDRGAYLERLARSLDLLVH